MRSIHVHSHHVGMSVIYGLLPFRFGSAVPVLLLPFCVVLLGSCGRSTGKDACMPIHVSPFYNSEGTRVAVGKYSDQLARADASSIGKTIAAMKSDWNELRPEAMYVAAIRLFDLGLQDEAVYWFYSAQYRARLFQTLSDPDQVDPTAGEVFELGHAYSAFFQLVGPHINPYAFRNPKKLAETIAQVRTEGKTIPDFTKLYPSVAFVETAKWENLNQEVSAGISELLELIKEQAAASPDGVPADVPDDDDGQMHPRRVWSDPQVAALAIAAQEGDVGEIDRLVAAGVDVNTKGLMWHTPLYWTLQAENKPGFKRLLEHGANPNTETRTGDSVVHLAAERADDSEWLELALKHGGDPNLPRLHDKAVPNRPPIFDAMLHQNLHGVRLLIKAGANIEQLNEQGCTPLEQAVRGLDFDIACLLLEAGADYRVEAGGGKDIAAMIKEASFLEGPQTVWQKKAIEFIEQDAKENAPPHPSNTK